MTGIRNELLRMYQMVKDNVIASFDVVISGDTKMLKKINDKEDYIDYLNKEISKYISILWSMRQMSKIAGGGGGLINAYFRICTNLERVADHAMNIAEYSLRLAENKVKFTKEAYEELETMKKYSVLGMETVSALDKMNSEEVVKTAAIEQKIDDLTREYRANHLRRMHKAYLQ